MHSCVGVLDSDERTTPARRAREETQALAKASPACKQYKDHHTTVAHQWARTACNTLQAHIWEGAWGAGGTVHHAIETDQALAHVAMPG